MIDSRNDELLGLSQAAAACPQVDGKRPHASSLWRWMRKGCRGVHLEHIKVGRRVVTTRQALEDFFRATAEAPLPSTTHIPAPPKSRTERQRQRDMAEARKTLRACGINVEGAA